MTTTKTNKKKHGNRILKFKPFVRFARKSDLPDEALIEASDEIEKGLVEADLGGGVFKKRIARAGEGKSGGYRAIVFFKAGDKTFFVHIFAKSDEDNISPKELKDFKKLAGVVLRMREDEIKKQIKSGYLTEVKRDEKENKSENKEVSK